MLQLKLAPASQSQVEPWIGHGTRELLIQAVAASAGKAESAERSANYFEQIASALPATTTSHYNQRCGTRSIAYPGAVEALEKLPATGVDLAIVTNKEAAYTRRILDAQGLTVRFKKIGAATPCRPKNPVLRA